MGAGDAERQGRNNQETIVQHWDTILVLPPKDTHTNLSELFPELHSPQEMEVVSILGFRAHQEAPEARLKECPAYLDAYQQPHS